MELWSEAHQWGAVVWCCQITDDLSADCRALVAACTRCSGPPTDTTLSEWRLFEVVVLRFNSYTERCIIHQLRGRGGLGGLWVRGSRNGQKTWRGVGACWGVRGAGSLDKLTVLDWLWGRVADVGINFILLLFAPRLYGPLLWREEQNQLYCFDAAVSRECMTSLYSSLNFKLHSVAATSLGFKSGGFFSC